MKLNFIKTQGRSNEELPNSVILQYNNWNDYGYVTKFDVHYNDQENEKHKIGSVRIAFFDMGNIRQTNDVLPEQFSQLDQGYFSLGLDDDYYDTINHLDDNFPGFRDVYLNAIRDCAKDLALFEQAKEEQVTENSLLRSFHPQMVRGQFHRMAHGGARVTEYHFMYQLPELSEQEPPSLSFDVIPESTPPSNIHIIIGRNGVGKTHILHHFQQSILQPDHAEFGNVVFGDNSDFLRALQTHATFTNIVTVSFSAFDRFDPIQQNATEASPITCNYIGLKQPMDDGSIQLKDIDALTAEFGAAVEFILQNNSKKERWFKALSSLESDPVFRQLQLIPTINEYWQERYEQSGFSDNQLFMSEFEESLKNRFNFLSSGHKIILLTITKLVEMTEERTLILMDEPESHLHLPLLSAFTRALSELLINRNAVAIIATHSPVVLQEVPKNCVHKISRSGNMLSVERPKIETFGENLSTLTHEIFGLEVTDSGFHKMLADEVENGLGYDEILSKYDGKLGYEARAIVRSLIASRDQRSA